jgi:hypothetical protein
MRIGSPYPTEDDGSFKLVVMPGPGVIGARVGNEHYRLGVGADTIKGARLSNAGLEMISAEPSYLIPTNYHTVLAINPQGGDDSVSCEIALDRGRTVKGKVVDSEGRPLTGTRIEGLQDVFRTWSYQPLSSAEFLVEGIGPGAERDLLVYHQGKQLAGAYTIKAGETGPVTVKLEPCGIVTGRLVDSDGLPLAEAELTGSLWFKDLKHEYGRLPDPIKTDQHGRFRAEGLVPGRKYTLHLWKGRIMIKVVPGAKEIVVARGQTKDLGDLTVSPN